MAAPNDMPASHTPLALAIVASSTLIAAAIVFATVWRSPAPTPAPPTPTPPVAPPPAQPIAAPTTAPAPLEPPTLPASVRQRGLENAARALEQLRPHLVATCWEPARDRPGPPSIPLQFNLSFAADGSLAGWGVSEDRTTHRADVAACVRGVALDAVKIPAPGAPLLVEVPFTLP